ncbi:MAG: bifunctional 5,10-methylenetetrahydrofolate dehydrogenase/5,10-methenyltetrahydrofolate cyclohydrolase [Acidobacteria bacterium]|nr:MAG: bifunctional 5,10-methylenetetrahydrofolate dehydrogenase/5,10-methenyltetrahydrofolate cyclohydrolase [Acidobacteriota bacterium]REK02392.1 MAG: bifunctional 5,10-methylenetetrahydrofolate dehydrogenase/5,10-methenyltetrahydrofolate cyclohydrolase [Acidobacteriota bacterium]REK13806.1 MAG: bifunctional 5,10-methylenetetrahydrofolate dehydrogenase/5,10-methenyltetrahydrofolate cyclohydrolase [Acidobacteriota bacterium]REK41800.1 MAG: bifunctional 5,10-methylenetetrahydrofolate dehydrogen
MKQYPAELLSGKEIAAAIKEEVAEEVSKLRVVGIEPCLVVVRVGEDAASEVYVNSKIKTARELGIVSEHKHLAADVSQEDLLATVEELNERDEVDGILVQLPLPKHIDETAVLETIDPEKDVDGFHPVNAGRLFQGHEALVPCTPAGVIDMLKRKGIELKGANAVVVGRSNIVGKPMAMLLLQEHATVTICHSRTKDLAAVCSQADVLIAAVGVTGIIKEEHIKPGAAVVDVGMNSIEDTEEAKGFFGEDELEKRLRTIEKRGSTLVGDVNAKAAKSKAGYFTPVPGGVGLLTVAMLMKNTVKAARMRRGEQ